MKFFYMLAVPYLILVVLGVYLYSRNRRLKRQQDALVASLKGQRFWRINIAQPDMLKGFKSLFRLLPFQAKGVLVEDGAVLRIKGFWLHKNKRSFESVVFRGEATPRWLGNQSIRAGNLYWGQITTPTDDLLFTADTGFYALTSREALADIFRSVFPDYPLSEAQTRDFALDKNPRSQGMVLLFFALMGFTLLDVFVFSRFEWVASQRLGLWWLVLVLPVAALGLWGLVYRFLVRGSVPARESLVLGMMVAVMIALAAVPALKRVDQVLAAGAVRSYVYHVRAGAWLEPVNPDEGLPVLRFAASREYWASLPEGSVYAIPLLRGPLGLWQLDHAQFDPPLRQYYQKESGKPSQ